MDLDLIKREYENKNLEKEVYLDDLKNIIMSYNYTLEGNYFYHPGTLEIFPDLFRKQANLFWCGKQGVTNICEIGFNAGHSTMLMLLGRDNSPLNFTIFDIGRHPYTKPAFDYIKSKFSHINFEYIEGDSTITMPDWINNHKDLIGKYDVVHVDGGHSEDCIFNDMKNTDMLVKMDGIVVIDDTDNHTINKYVDLYISGGNYVELKLFPSNTCYGYGHRVIKKIK